MPKILFHFIHTNKLWHRTGENGISAGHMQKVLLLLLLLLLLSAFI